MATAAELRPDVLVLAGGGIVGEAWMHGLLGGIEDGAGVDFREVEAFVGTSAGSIVAARLAAGRRPPRPEGVAGGASAGGGAADREAPRRGGATADDGGDASAWGGDAVAADDGADAGRSLLRGVVRDVARVGWVASAPVASAALALGAPAGGLARSVVLARATGHGRPLTQLRERVARWDARFDGRLRVCTVDRRTGRRVTFGAPGAPPATVADAVCASCAIPWVFSPVRIGEREYVDGGAWSITNLDAAQTGSGTRVLCLDPAAALGGAGTDRRMAALRAAFRTASELERQVLRRRGTHVLHVAPDAAAAQAIGTNLMSPAHARGALAAGYEQGLTLSGAAASRRA